MYEPWFVEKCELEYSLDDRVWQHSRRPLRHDGREQGANEKAKMATMNSKGVALKITHKDVGTKSLAGVRTWPYH